MMRPDEERFLPGLYSARNLFSGRWMPAVSVVLLDGPKHYTEILSSVRPLGAMTAWPEKDRVLHEGILTRTLQRMTVDELIVREEEEGVFPPSVRYALTPATKQMLDAAVPLAEWAHAHAELVERAKHRRRGARSGT